MPDISARAIGLGLEHSFRLPLALWIQSHTNKLEGGHRTDQGEGNQHHKRSSEILKRQIHPLPAKDPDDRMKASIVSLGDFCATLVDTKLRRASRQ